MGENGPPGRNLWTEERRELLGVLTRRHTNLGDFYKQAVVLLQEETSVITMCLLAHTVRELVNLAGELLLEDGQHLPPRSDVDDACRNLVTVWRDENLPLEIEQSPEESDAALEPDSRSLVTVPRAALAAAAEVVTRFEEASANAGARYSAVATGYVDRRGHATTELVHQVIRYFLPWFHVRQNPRQPNKDETERHFVALENVLRTRTAAFFDVADDLTALLADANSLEQAGEEQQ
jgi:hypothetical protein